MCLYLREKCFGHLLTQQVAGTTPLSFGHEIVVDKRLHGSWIGCNGRSMAIKVPRHMTSYFLVFCQRSQLHATNAILTSRVTGTSLMQVLQLMWQWYNAHGKNSVVPRCFSCDSWHAHSAHVNLKYFCIS
jgi:hypothetical protein